MSNFKLIDQTKSSVTGSDLLVAGSIVGSFLFFVIKSQKNKVVVLHKKGKLKTEKPAIESENQNTIKSNQELPQLKGLPTLHLKSRLPIKTFLFNPMTMKAFQGTNNPFDLLKSSKDVEDFMSLIPKPKHIPIERLLLTETELEELRDIAAHKKKNRYTGTKHIHTDGNQEENEDLWSIREYDAQDFDLENVYEDFMDNKKRRILQKHTRKNSSSSLRRRVTSTHQENKEKKERNSVYDSPFINYNMEENDPEVIVNLDGNEFEEETKVEKTKKSKNFQMESPETQAILKRYEEAAKKLTENPYNFKKNTFLTRKEAEQRAMLIANINVNCLMNFNEDGECTTSLKLTFNLKSLNYEDELFLDYSGKYIISISINQKTIKPSDIWFENKIMLHAKYLKEGQNVIMIVIQNVNFDSINNRFDNEEQKFINPNNVISFNSKIFFNHPEKKINTVFPVFDQPGFIANFILGILIPKINYVITSTLEKLNQPMKEESKFNSLQCHEAIFNNMEDFIDKRLLLYQMKTDPTCLGFCVGEFEPIYERDNLRFFSVARGKEKLVEIITPASEIMQLGLCTFKKFIKNILTKIDVIILPDLPKSIFSYQGMIFVDERLLLVKENMAEFYYLMLKELAKQFLFTRMKWLDDAWIFEGLPNYMANLFFEQIGDIDNITQNLPFNEIMTYIRYLKLQAIFVEVMNLSHPLYLNIENNYEKKSLQEAILKFKPVYFFKQLFIARGKKSLTDIFMKMSHYITNKEFIEIVKEIDNSQMDEMVKDWLTTEGINEIKIGIHGDKSKATCVKDFSIIQTQFGKEKDPQLKKHFTDILLLNQSGRSQFSLEIEIKKERETIINQLEGKYLPKAILIDSDDYDYFKMKLDENSLTFLIENLYKIDHPKIRLNLYYCFYFEMLDGKFNQLAFLDIILKNLEKESSYIVFKYILKLCRPLLFLGFEKEKEIEYCEKFMFLILKLIEQGKFPNLMYKYIPQFSIIPQSTSLLESIFNEKHSSLTRHYKSFSQKSKMKLLARILACESIGNEKRIKYQESFIESINEKTLKEKARLVFQAVTPSEEEKNKIWFIFSENVKNIKLSILKSAMRAFMQQGQYIFNEMFYEKYFEELPLIINKHDQEYSFEFVKSLFPRNLLNEEFVSLCGEALTKVDEENEPRISKFLKEKILMIKKMKEVAQKNVNLE